MWENKMKRSDWQLLYTMKLGDYLLPDKNTKITRVPGGWVYGDIHGVCFIPFDNEFMEIPK